MGRQYVAVFVEPGPNPPSDADIRRTMRSKGIEVDEVVYLSEPLPRSTGALRDEFERRGIRSFRVYPEW